ncbi:unnamed protein product [Paramecium sonneborni]|uniref:Uncharacterized protein n=1 Tax=Paramecium sonneborni TaxID=65129 RepID=A0A8S1LPC7_9CILI|nr:unnamed protein product [Paramecium sonneborni]
MNFLKLEKLKTLLIQPVAQLQVLAPLLLAVVQWYVRVLGFVIFLMIIQQQMEQAIQYYLTMIFDLTFKCFRHSNNNYDTITEISQNYDMQKMVGIDQSIHKMNMMEFIIDILLITLVVLFLIIQLKLFW